MREFIYQENEKGCGLACLRMAMIEATGQSGYKYLQLEGHPPYNLKSLQDAAGENGVKLNFYRAKAKNELACIKTFPIILLLNDEGREHLVYVPKAKKDKLLVYDPAKGKYWIKTDDILEKWGLVYGDFELIEKKKCKYKKPRIVSTLDNSIMFLFQILSCVALFAGFYFMEDDSNYILSIALLASYGIFEIAFRAKMVASMKKYDRKWLHKISENPKIRKDRFEHFYELKKSIFPSMAGFIGALITALALSLLFGLNNSIFFLAEAILMLYSLLYAIFAYKKTHKRISALKVDEENFITSKVDANNDFENLKRINDESYKIASFISYEKIIFTIVTIMLTLLFFLDAPKISLNYFLLYFGALFMVGEKFKEILEWMMNYPIREKEILYFYEYFIKEE